MQINALLRKNSSRSVIKRISVFFCEFGKCAATVAHTFLTNANTNCVMQPVSSPIHTAKKQTTFFLHPLATTRLVLHDLEELRSQRRRLATLSLLLTQLLLLESSSIGVQAQQDLLVLERVLLLYTSTLGLGLALGCAQDALDFRAVDQAGKVGLGNDVGRQEEVLLQGRGLSGRSVNFVEGLEGSGGPDDEAA